MQNKAAACENEWTLVTQERGKKGHRLRQQALNKQKLEDAIEKALRQEEDDGVVRWQLYRGGWKPIRMMI
jgi:hypothetical protein